MVVARRCISLILCLFFYGCFGDGSETKSGNHTGQVLDDHSGHQHGEEFYYTCAMHPEVRADKPGKCPICNMNLTKVAVETPVFEPEPTTKSYYTCSMHPEIRADGPGKCPICNMNLTKIELEDDSSQGAFSQDANTEDLDPASVVASIKLRKSQLSHFKPDFFPVQAMKMSRKVRLLGTIVQSERKESKIPARVDGRIEKVFVESTGSLVRSGDPILQVYSPALISTGEEYILAKKNIQSNPGKEFRDLLEQTEKRLRLWGIQKFQYERWFQKNRVPQNITIFAENQGIVQKRHAVEGKYFKAGQVYMELSDLSSVWIEMDVYEHDAALVKIGQHVDLNFTALPGESLSGKIDFINPVLDPKSRTLKVRTTIENKLGKLMPGMVAVAFLNVDFDDSHLVVPRSAVINTGERKVAWVKIGADPSRFQAKLIRTGLESEGYVEIIDGLVEGDQVVAEGNFLLDAQAQLFGGYEDFKPVAKDDDEN